MIQTLFLVAEVFGAASRGITVYCKKHHTGNSVLLGDTLKNVLFTSDNSVSEAPRDVSWRRRPARRQCAA